MKSIFVMCQRYNKKHICANCENIDAFSETDDWDKLCNFAVSNRTHTMKIMTILASSIVIFFSHAGDNYSVGNIEVGNTKIVADYISEITGADQYEIVTHKYDGMAYTPLINLAKEEANKGELPPYEGEAPDLSKYATVFIGGPIWWGTYPPIINTFLEHYNLMGKTIIPFSTSEGSGLLNTVAELREVCKGATVTEALAIRGSQARQSEKKVSEWAKKMIENL